MDLFATDRTHKPRGARIAMSAFAGFVLFACGCRSAELDPVERAKRISTLLVESDKIVTSVKAEFDEERIKGKPNAKHHLSRLLEAEEMAREAVSLHRESSLPSKAVIRAQYLIYHIYLLLREEAADDLEAEAQAGRKPSKRLLDARDENDRLAGEYYRRTAGELTFYIENFHRRGAPWADAYFFLIEMHELQGEWEAAIAVAKSFIRNERPQGEILVQTNKRIAKLEELLLDSKDQRRKDREARSP